MSQLLGLPLDIHETLLQYLTVADVLKLEATCGYCHDLTDLYWRKLTHLELVPFLRIRGPVDVGNAFKFDNAASGILKKVGPYLLSLDISKFGPLEYGLRSGFESSLLSECTLLERLDLDNRLLDSDWLIKLSTAVGNTLRFLSLGHLHVRNGRGLDDQLLSQMLPHLPSLEWLSLRDNKRIRLTCWQLLPQALTYLDIQGCSVSTEFAMECSGHCTNLDSLSLTYSTNLCLQPEESLGSLTELYITSVPQNSQLDDLMIQSVGRMPKLQVVVIASELVSDALIQTLCLTCRNLRDVSFPGVRAPGNIEDMNLCFEMLARTQLHLTRLSTRANRFMGVSALVTLHKFVVLQRLDVSFAVKESQLNQVWDNIKSDSLKVLEIKGIAPPTRPKQALIANLMRRLRPNCPQIKQIIL